MKVIERDPGLQPERTSMSWFRTQLLMVWVGLILMKLGLYHGVVMFCLVSGIILLTAFAGLLYNQRRFIAHFNDQMAVGDAEIVAKKILSSVVFITATTYGLYTAGVL